jgi:hypothetical protein
MDQEEAREIAEAHLQTEHLEGLYESVLLPALRLAEEDRHRDALGDRISASIFQSTRELLEDLGDRIVRVERDDESDTGTGSVSYDSRFGGPGIVCVPASDEADELAGMMLSHLLLQVGQRSSYLPVATVNDILERVSQGSYNVVCISALPPFAAGQARSLCRQIRTRFPEIAIVVGLWGFPGGSPKAQERVGSTCTDAVATTLSEALQQVRRLAGSTKVDQGTTISAQRVG